MRTGALVRILPNEEGYTDPTDNKIGLVLGPSFHVVFPYRVLIEDAEYFLAEDEIEEIKP